MNKQGGVVALHTAVALYKSTCILKPNCLLFIRTVMAFSDDLWLNVSAQSCIFGSIYIPSYYLGQVGPHNQYQSQHSDSYSFSNSFIHDNFSAEFELANSNYIDGWEDRIKAHDKLCAGFNKNTSRCVCEWRKSNTVREELWRKGKWWRLTEWRKNLWWW